MSEEEKAGRKRRWVKPVLLLTNRDGALPGQELGVHVFTYRTQVARPLRHLRHVPRQFLERH